MKKLLSLFSVLALTIGLSACATPVTHNTPSGKVEVTINGAKKSVVKEKIVNEMINRGYTVTKSDDVSLVVDHPVTSAVAGILYASRYDSQPNARVTYSLIQNKHSVRVIADFAIITNPGSAFESRSDLNEGQDTIFIQDVLDYIKSDIEGAK